MATQLKEVRVRIASIKKTLQITKAMKMASVNKLKKSQSLFENFRPYVQSATQILARLVKEHPNDLGLLSQILKKSQQPEGQLQQLLIVISSDKGLCGAYNTNLFKQICGQFDLSDSDKLTVLPIGRKGSEFFQRRNIPLISDFQELYHNPQNQQISQLVELLTKLYLDGKYAQIHLAHTHFISQAGQNPQIHSIFPPVFSENIDDTRIAINYEDELEYCVQNILRLYLSATLYGAILDAQVSEHSARVNAMEQASENANKISEQLKISYNRARQTLITKEVIEIISGAANLS